MSLFDRDSFVRDFMTFVDDAGLEDRDDRWRVWRMQPDGARQTPLTAGPIDIQPLVTGDGRSVYFVRLSEPVVMLRNVASTR